MTLQQLIQKRVDRLESVPDSLLTVIDKENEKLFQRVLQQLKSLELEDGKVVASKRNLAIVSNIIEELKGALFNGEYVQAIKDFAVEIQAQAKLNNQILEATLGIS